MKPAALILIPAVMLAASAAFTQPTSEDLISSGTCTYEMKSFERKTGECADPYKDCAAVVLRYPVITQAPRAASENSLNTFALTSVLRSFSGEEVLAGPDELADEFFADYESVRKAFPDYTTGWSLERSVEVIHNAPQVVSLTSRETSYTGGAHPNSFVTYASFDMVTGKQIGLVDIFKDGYEPHLTQVAEKRFRELKHLAPDLTLTDAGFWFDGGQFRLNSNFAVIDHGLVFYFNAYEIAAYAAGPTELTIPYEDLKPLVKEDRQAWFRED